MSESVQHCVCGSDKPSAACCDRFLSGSAVPETAEQLMRSRYVAFCNHHWTYLAQTCHPDHPQAQLDPNGAGVNKELRWVSLQILATERGATHDTEGYVDFIARYHIAGVAHAMREKSHFMKYLDRWCYVGGKSLALPKNNASKISRNDLCPCGSGKKFKRCCGP